MPSPKDQFSFFTSTRKADWGFEALGGRFVERLFLFDRIARDQQHLEIIPAWAGRIMPRVARREGNQFHGDPTGLFAQSYPRINSAILLPPVRKERLADGKWDDISGKTLWILLY